MGLCFTKIDKRDLCDGCSRRGDNLPAYAPNGASMYVNFCKKQNCSEQKKFLEQILDILDIKLNCVKNNTDINPLDGLEKLLDYIKKYGFNFFAYIYIFNNIESKKNIELYEFEDIKIFITPLTWLTDEYNSELIDKINIYKNLYPTNFKNIENNSNKICEYLLNIYNNQLTIIKNKV